MTTLRTRLTLIFVVATALPLAACLWLASSLLERSLDISPVAELDAASRALQHAGHEYYSLARESLRTDATAGRIRPTRVAPTQFDAETRDFWNSAAPERFLRTADHLTLLRREPAGVVIYTAPLQLNLPQLSGQYRAARQAVDNSRSRDLLRGFRLTLALATAFIWAASLLVLIYIARRVSRPIRDLTGGLSQLAAGNFAVRLPLVQHLIPNDEIGHATAAFNNTAAHLEQNRDRLVYLTQLASWQVLARKTAHEIKNSLTPIRLTVEEMVVRSGDRGPESEAFLGQAASIVVDEIESLERRIRAFSDFSAEPPVCPEPLDINAVVEERIAFLRSSHPEIEYAVRLAERIPTAVADQDLVRSILVNLLENAAEAAGAGGRVLAFTAADEDRIVVEVHDSGPGLSELARKSLFQPTISFKKRGMGLGLSIARKCALLTGGDLLLVAGELGGAGFRVVLPKDGQS
jgi:nitrogen fixation/metabolism regulation signal transduction histidine kinase